MDRGCRVLILEDSPADAELMERHLRKTGVEFSARRVETRDAFCAALDGPPPDLILADYSLPQFDGLSALVIVRERRPDVPFIFVSGSVGEERAIEALKSGATDYVLKDRLERLGPVVRRALQEADERRRRNAAEDRFRRAVEASPNAMLIVDATGRITLANAQAETLFGYPRAELLGSPVEALVPERFRGGHAAHRAGFLANPQARLMGQGRDLFALRKDGAEVPVEIGLNPLDAPEGTFVLASIVDITERKRAEEAAARHVEELRAERQAAFEYARAADDARRRAEASERKLAASIEDLARSNRELEQFAYVASHDLQEPLRMVASFMQLLERRYQGRLDEHADTFIRHAVEGARRMQELITDLLKYSRVARGDLLPEPVDCGRVVEEARANLQVALREAGASLTADTLPTVQGIRSLLREVFQNLIDNALKYRRDVPPQVHVGAALRDGQWVFSVSDNGLGIEPQHLERIFTIFQRLHVRGKYPGTGIGLAICKKIVERHGGRIWAESEAGRGSTFHFSVPAAPGGAPLA